MPDSHLYLTLRLGGLPHYVASPTMRLCTTDGSAFAWLSSHSLVEYLGRQLTVEDSAGKQAIGYIKEADAGEAFGAELYIAVLDNHVTLGFETWTVNVLDITQAENTSTYGICHKNITHTTGKLYKATFDYTLNGGINPSIRLGANTASLGDAVTALIDVLSGTDSYIYYWNQQEANMYCGFRNESGDVSDFAIANLSIKEVTHIGTDGVHIVSASGGATRNWTSIDTGFDPNDPAHVTVY